MYVRVPVSTYTCIHTKIKSCKTNLHFFASPQRCLAVARSFTYIFVPHIHLGTSNLLPQFFATQRNLQGNVGAKRIK